eukprot:4234444-Karenia_brevis.AAC.1
MAPQLWLKPAQDWRSGICCGLAKGVHRTVPPRSPLLYQIKFGYHQINKGGLGSPQQPIGIGF